MFTDTHGLSDGVTKGKKHYFMNVAGQGRENCLEKFGVFEYRV